MALRNKSATRDVDIRPINVACLRVLGCSLIAEGHNSCGAVCCCRAACGSGLDPAAIRSVAPAML
jgi:hypothetical protein